METTYPVNNWIRYIKEKGGETNKGDKVFSKEIRRDEEVNMVQKFTKNGNCEVSCKGKMQVGTGRTCTVHGAGVRGNTHDNCRKYYYVDRRKVRQTKVTHRNG